MPPNVNFVQRKIKLIQEDLAVLDKLSRYSFEEISKDYIKFSALERILEKIIMRAIDVNQHLISEIGKGEEKIRGYEDTFYTLAGLGVYGDVFAKKNCPKRRSAKQISA